jgi:uncharacterized coiled-coil protein SlyX
MIWLEIQPIFEIFNSAGRIRRLFKTRKPIIYGRENVNRIEETAVSIQKKCGELAALLHEQEWHSLDRNGFERACQSAILELKEIKRDSEQLEKMLSFETIENEKEFRKKNSEISVLIQRLEKNLELEQKKSASKLSDFDFLPETKRYNEQFSSLQHQAATILLQTNYLIEKLLLETRKESLVPVNEKTTSQSLLELLRQRENELQEAKKTVSQARRQSLLGSQEMEGAAELEEELQETNQKIAVQQRQIEESMKQHGQSTEKMSQSAEQLAREMASMQQLASNHFEQSQELLTRLKKERDFARQLALDTEMETLGLRSQYSRELLGMQEKIAVARLKTKQEFEQRIQKMENELEHKNQLISHFKETVNSQSRKIDELQEKVTRLRLLLETHNKHTAFKKAFKARKKQKSLGE